MNINMLIDIAIGACIGGGIGVLIMHIYGLWYARYLDRKDPLPREQDMKAFAAKLADSTQVVCEANGYDYDATALAIYMNKIEDGGLPDLFYDCMEKLRKSKNEDEYERNMDKAKAEYELLVHRYAVRKPGQELNA